MRALLEHLQVLGLSIETTGHKRNSKDAISKGDLRMLAWLGWRCGRSEVMGPPARVASS